MMTPLPISAIVLTYNEEANLETCLASLFGWVSEILVVDSGSTDRTLEIAERFGARTVLHEFETHARQWGWALQHLECKHEWILGLDADQSVTGELKEELAQLFTRDLALLQTLDGLFVKRRQIFRGQWIRHGGYYPKYLLKLFRRGKVRVDLNDLMDHHFYISGPVRKLSSDIVEDNRKEADIAFWIEKHNRYAALQAREEYLRRTQARAWPIPPDRSGNPDQQVLWLKQHWYRLPLFVRPVLYFFRRYFLQFGFLDGKQGLVFHFLQGLWYRLLVDVHLDDLLTHKRHLPEQEMSVGEPGAETR